MIRWWIALALTAGLPHAIPMWGWVMIVPFAWGLTSTGRIRRAAAGGAAIGAVVWGVAAAVALVSGSARPAAARIAVLLDPLTGGRPWTLLAATAVIGAVAAGAAAAAGRGVAPSRRRPGSGAP